MKISTKTLKVRIKDKHAKLLSQWAFECNQVWNAANALTAEYAWVPIPGIGFMNCNTSEYDLQKELKTIRDERDLSIGAATVQSVIAQHAKSRKQFKKNKLQWRCSSGSKRSLGWIPFKTAGIKYMSGQIRFCGHYLSIWDIYDLSKYDLETGSFSQDARGRWYFNTAVRAVSTPSAGTKSIGVDLGLKTTATCSDGLILERRRITDEFAQQLAVAQRANKKQRVKAIHARIKHSRSDALHKFSTSMVENYGAIFVGDVSSKKLVKTKMAKSVLDTGWAILKTQLEYKANARSVVFLEVNEKYTSQTCSCCEEIPHNSPKGRIGLRIREWTCALCGALHDRDINAAKNILARGHARLAVGISTVYGGEDVKDRLLKKHGLADFFDLVICGDTLTVRKPNPEVIHSCLNILHETSNSSLFVGDSDTDIATAKSAEVPCWAVPYGYNAGRDIRHTNPDRLIDDIRVVPDFFTKI